MNGNEAILEVRNLKKYFFSGKKRRSRKPRTVKALDGINFSTEHGETLGVVGESGCGKSTLGRTILRLHEPTEGQVVYKGKNPAGYGREEMRQARREFQIISQGPYPSLDPRMTVKGLIYAPLDVFAMGSKGEREVRVIEITDKVGPPLELMNRYPHEFSGDQRQRIVIARALMLSPEFVVRDEPVSALDVSVRAQVLDPMMDLQKELNLTYLFIFHDLSMVRYICDRIMVMYLGSVMEIADRKVLYEGAKHPCTQVFLSAIPIPDMDIEYNKVHLEGGMPSPFNPSQGCRFLTRCRCATEKCRVQVPELKDVGDRHFVACHLHDEQRQKFRRQDDVPPEPL